MTHHHMLMYRFMSNVRDAEVPSREPNAGRSVSRLPRPKLHTAKLRPGRMLPSMSRQILLSICVFITVSVVACSRGLTHDEAKTVIERNGLAGRQRLTGFPVHALMVRATIRGRTANLKFRRFDKGWTWEFVETKAGGWIATDIAIGQIREEDRSAAASVWADQHKAAYVSTASAINILTIYVPNPTDGLDVMTWMKQRRRFAEFFKKRPDGPQDRVVVLANDHPADAWGSELLANFDSNNNAALILSTGPDKIKGTEDDLVCFSKFRRDIEDGRMVWARDKTWKLPEGLGSVVEPFTDKQTDKIEYTKVAKP